MGWTIEFRDLDGVGYGYRPLCYGILVMHLVLVAIEQFIQDRLKSWHNYDGIGGTTIAFVRIALYIFFLKGICKTLSNTNRKNVSTFLIHFSLLGTLYFLTFPFLVFINFVAVAPYW